MGHIGGIGRILKKVIYDILGAKVSHTNKNKTEKDVRGDVRGEPWVAEPRRRRGRGEVNLLPGSEGSEDHRFRKEANGKKVWKIRKKGIGNKKSLEDRKNGGRSTRRSRGLADSTI